MTNWTRAHDAWIARELEGLEVWANASDAAICDFQDDSIPHYLTDPAAAIRAAEAWACKAPEGTQRRSVIATEFCAGEKETAVSLHQNDWHPHCGTEPGESWAAEGGSPAAALAQALYRATGGPA